MNRNLFWCIPVFAALSACASTKLDLNKVAPDADVASKLPLHSSVMVYVAVPYFEKGTKGITKYMAARKLINAKKLEETSQAIAKKYFTNAEVYRPDKKANYFIFFSGDSYIDEIQVVSQIRGQVYDANGKLIYNKQVKGHEITGGPINDASFFNAVVSAQINFYDSLFKSEPRVLLPASEEKTALISSIADKIGKDNLRDISTASGFIINKSGNVLTNYHAISNCIRVDLHLGKIAKPATVLFSDKDADLALLGSQMPAKKHAVLADATYAPRLGDDIVVMGFPLQGVLASEPSLSTGNISALAGIKNNESVYQITAPIQQGSSGGPVLDTGGAVIGIVQSKLNALALADFTGDIPQNVNFAIKKDKIFQFLDQHKIKYVTSKTPKKLTTPDIAEMATSFTVEVSCLGYADPFHH